MSTKRQTKNSAGYDFYALEDVVIPAHEERNLNTGIKACMPADEHLELFIRSSYGIKYGLMLNNCVGIIDADYQSRRKTPVFRHGECQFCVSVVGLMEEKARMDDIWKL